MEASCQQVRRWDVLGVRRLVPRRFISLVVYAIARLKGLPPPQRMPLDRFALSPRVDDAYSLFALCAHTTLPEHGVRLIHGG